MKPTNNQKKQQEKEGSLETNTSVSIFLKSQQKRNKQIEN